MVILEALLQTESWQSKPEESAEKLVGAVKRCRKRWAVEKPLKDEEYRKYWDQDVVLYEGDTVIDLGTIEEVAERRGVRKETIYYYTTPACHRRANKNKIGGLRAVAVDIHEEDDE